MKTNYSKEEADILLAFNSGKLKKSKTSQTDIKVAKDAAINTIEQNKQIKISLSEKEIVQLKVKAVESGVSYQSLISALIHQYVDNRIQIIL